MKKNQIIAFGLLLLFLYGMYGYLLNAYHIFKSINDFSSTTLSAGFYIQFFTHLFNLIAILQFFISKYQRSALLKIALQFDIFNWIILFPIWMANILFIEPERTTNWMFPVISMLSACIYCYALYFLVKKHKPVLEPLGDGNHTFNPVRRADRFFHRMFDLLVIAYVVYSSFEYIGRFMAKLAYKEGSFLSPLGKFLQSDLSFYPLVYFFITLYYLMTEGIFNTTIGKTIMGNMVVNNIAGRPGIGQRIGRTFARLIPFEPLSFVFGSRGWHDDLTDTYVVKVSTQKDQYE